MKRGDLIAAIKSDLHMIKLQFATLQILNRAFRFKLESLLMYLLFSPLTILSYFKQRQKEKISFSPDKRLNWNAMRFDDTRDIRVFLESGGYNKARWVNRIRKYDGS